MKYPLPFPENFSSRPPAIKVSSDDDFRKASEIFANKGFPISVDDNISKLVLGLPRNTPKDAIYPLYLQICWLPWCGDYLRIWDNKTQHMNWVMVTDYV